MTNEGNNQERITILQGADVRPDWGLRIGP